MISILQGSAGILLGSTEILGEIGWEFKANSDQSDFSEVIEISQSIGTHTIQTSKSARVVETYPSMRTRVKVF